MKSILLSIIVIATLAFPLVWFDQAYASCIAEDEINWNAMLSESESVFTGTVTRLDNYDGPQKVTFLVHDVIKGEVDTPKFILENSELIFLENDTIMSSSVNVDYKIGKTYKVFVTNGQTNQCTTKLTAPPADYMWEPGPEDGNYYSANPEYVHPCDEGYGLSDGVCITLEEMNKDLSTCTANPRHDFGKCKKNTEESPNTFEQVKEHCDNGGEDIFLEWWDDDVYYNNEDCELIDRDGFGAPPPEPEPEQDITEYANCSPGTILQDGVCVMISKKDSADTDVKWEEPFYENLPPPNLEPIRDYDYESIYMTILATVGIIGGVVGGMIFVIRRKRK